MEAADFSGYATKAGLKCSDGRVISPEAFQHMDGSRVPLVWQHGHHDPKNVVGHAVLEARPDGVYAYGFFNDTEAGQSSRVLVQHKDITMLSIYANQLVEKGKRVLHGTIKEVSLVLAGANPEALIDNVRIAHSDGDVETLEDEAIIYTGLVLEHDDMGEDESDEDDFDETEEDEMGDIQHQEEKTLRDVYETLNQEQKDLVHFMIGAALDKQGGGSDEAAQSDIDPDDTIDEDEVEPVLTHTEGTEDMTRNVFDQSGRSASPQHTLSHSDVQTIVQDFQRTGSMKAAVESYALQHGIENLDVLFPDAEMVGQLELDARRTAWVSQVMGGVRKSPFNRIKTAAANLTYDDARAKGYVKGDMKKEEFFSLSKRETTPQTIYKKQSLDRDDVIDITDLDIVSWMKAELKLMLEEEVARAILVGDGRDPGDEDKIQPTKIRPIASDDPFFAVQVAVNLGDTDSTHEEIVDAAVRSRRLYKGSGSPTFFTSETHLAELMLLKDADGHRLYKTETELANAMRVGRIVEVEAFDEDPTLIGVIVNLTDYVVGANKGGQTTMFDDFDIDFNKLKYLLEGRMCGALTKPHSALVLRDTDAGDSAVAPQAPTWAGAPDYEITIPTQTGVVYENQAGDTLTGTVALNAGDLVDVFAVADTGYYVAPGSRTRWSYMRPTGS